MMIQCVPDMEGSSSHHHDEALCVAEDFNVDFRLQQQHPKNNHHHHHNSSSRMLDLVAEQRSQQLAEIQVPHCQQQQHHHQQQQQQPPQTQLMYHGYSPLTELIWKDGQLALNNLENRSMGAKNNNILAGCYSGPSNFFSSSSSLGSAEEDSCQWVSQDECGVLSAMDIDMVPPWVEDLGTHKSLERSAFGDNPSPHLNQNGNADSTAVAVASEGLGISKCSTKLSRFSGHHHHGSLAHEQGELPSESKAALQILASSDQADTALFSNSNSETDASKSKTNNSTSTTGLLPRTNSISWSDCRQRTSTATFSDYGDAMATTFPPSSSAVSPTASMSQMKQANDSSKCKRKSFNCQQDSPHQSDQEEEDKGSSQVSKSESKRSSHAKRSRAAVVHNQSERRRRDRINERMKTLQKLLPHSSKTDKASMLDEAIEYLKHLQAQLQMMMFRNGMGMHPIMMPVSLPQLQMSMLASMGHVGLGMGMPGVMGIMNMNAVSAAAAAPTGQDPGLPLNPQRHHPALVPPVPFIQPAAAAAAITPAVAAISSETAVNPLQHQPVGLTMEAYHKLLLQQQQLLLQSQSGTMNKQNEQWHPQ